MIKRFLAWLKSIYFKPATADIKTPEVVIMSEPLQDQPINHIPASSSITDMYVQQPAPAVGVKSGVADLDAALKFIESGVAQLGDAAKDELKELAKKYL